MMRAFWLAADTQWAITKPALEQILEIAARDNLDPEAVAAKLGRPLKNTQTVDERDGVAILPMQGPIFPKANLFTEISGATSIQVLATDFTAALNDPASRGIAIDCDTPGGAVSGVNEFAQMIYDSRGI
jgi:ClpP class serine protease